MARAETNRCKICEMQFDSEKGLHSHVAKKHEISTKEYYEEYFPRHSLYHNKKIPFTKNRQEYFGRDFIDEEEMRYFLQNRAEDGVKHWMLSALKKRMREKCFEYAPSHLELVSTPMMPNLIDYVSFFGGYDKVCEILKCEPLFLSQKKVEPIKFNDPTILIDTREQKPLKFKNSRKEKLYVGDYTLDKENYNYTYVDRKSEEDFKYTLTAHFDRFCREIERAIEIGAFLYVVVESTVEKTIKNNVFGAYQHNIQWTFNSMRRLHHLYPRKVQFVFSGSRRNSMQIIPYLLMYGDKMWNLDVQYILDSKNLTKE